MDITQQHIDEYRDLLCKIVEQAVRDWLSLDNSRAPIEQYYYETACQFLFDDEYYIDYGGIEKNLQDILDIMGLNLEWFRENIVKQKDKRIRSRKELVCAYQEKKKE